MAKGTYERRVLNTHIENFQQQLERSYSQYQEGSYIPVIYYQLDKSATRVDGALDVAQNIIGNATSRKYKKIIGVPLYGLASGINYELEFTETSFKNITSGQAYLAPGTIKPSADDFFVIDRQGLRNHLFKITSFDFNTANPNKYYQFNFELYQNSASEILNNISGEYKFLIENMGSNQNTIVKTADEYLMNKAKKVTDILIDKYVYSFYDYGHDTFTLRADKSDSHVPVKLWNPYMIRFLNEHDIITKYEYDVMTEIFVPEYFEGGYSKWFKDDVWIDSFYNKVVNRTPLEIVDLFTVVDDSNSLSKWIKLPFYQSAEEIYLDSLANDYTKNFLSIGPEFFKTIDSSIWNRYINLKSIFSKSVNNKHNDEVKIVKDKYLLELEWFSENARSVWENSKLGDIYYVYNNNSGHIDNVYLVSTIPGEVSPLPEEDLLESNMYFKLLDNFINDSKKDQFIVFFNDNMEITSSWSVLSDGFNKFIGKADGTIFSKNSAYVDNELINIISKYYNNVNLTEGDIDNLAKLNIRRDSAISYYLVPLVIYVLKEYINRIQN